MRDLLFSIGLFYELTDGGSTIVVLLCLLSIIFGVLSCFFGYKIFKFIVGVCGFVIGALAGIILISASNGDASGPAVIVTAIVGGIIGAFLAVKLYFIGIFFIGALFGGLTGYTLTLGNNSDNSGVLILVLAIIAGILAVIIKKFMIILSTSVSGAQSISMAIVILMYVLSGKENDSLYNILWIILAIVGFCYQYSSNKKSPVGTDVYDNGRITGNSISLSENSIAHNFAKYKNPLIVAGLIILVLILLRFASAIVLPILVIIAIAFAVYVYVTGKNYSTINKIECKSCHTLNQNSNIFCVKCGVDLKSINTDSVKEQECPMCKQSIKENDNYCTGCGHKIAKDVL